MAQRIAVTENGRKRLVSREELILLRLANDAARGDARATKLLLELNERYRDRPESATRSQDVSAEDRQILADYFRRAEGDQGGGSTDGEGGDGEIL